MYTIYCIAFAILKLPNLAS